SIFFVKLLGTMTMEGRSSRFLYVTGEAPTFFAYSPIGLALDIEVINNKPTLSKLRSYTVDVRNKGGNWIRVYSLPMASNRSVYYVENDKLKTGVKFDIGSNSLDIAAESDMQPGG